MSIIAPLYIRQKLSEYDSNLTIEWRNNGWMICENEKSQFLFNHKNGDKVIKLDGCMDELLETIKMSDSRAGLNGTRKRWNIARIRRKERSVKAKQDRENEVESEMKDRCDFAIKNGDIS